MNWSVFDFVATKIRKIYQTTMAIYLYFRKIAIFYLLMSDNTNLLLLQLKLQKKKRMTTF